MPVMERMDFQGKHWMVVAKIREHLIDDPSGLKKSYGCDLVLKSRDNYFIILDEILEGEFEDI